MKIEVRIAQWLLASVFIVMGGFRLWQALHGVQMSNMTLLMSSGEVLLGVLIAAGWQLRVMTLLAAICCWWTLRCRTRFGIFRARRWARNYCNS
mgnify:CR=1 FL=1